MFWIILVLLYVLIMLPACYLIGGKLRENEKCYTLARMACEQELMVQVPHWMKHRDTVLCIEAQMRKEEDS
jgi:hypothetical protein